MPRSHSSSGHTKGRSEPAGPLSSVASIFSGRATSRHSSKVISEDGNDSSPHHLSSTAAASQLLRSPSLSASDHGGSPGKPLNRHARMKKAMAEAQNEAIGEYTAGEEETTALKVPDSPRLTMAARARAREQEEGRAKQDSESSPHSLGLSSDEKPGEGALTFDLLDGNDVVTAEGVPPSVTDAKNGTSGGTYIPEVRSNSETVAAPGTPSVSPRTRTLDNLYAQTPESVNVPSQTASVLIPGEQAVHRDSTHMMHISQSTSALLPEHRGSGIRAKLPRKVSDTSSIGVISDSGRDSPTKMRKGKGGAPARGGIGAALAASGAGAIGLGYQGVQSLYTDRATSPAAVAAAAHAAHPMTRQASHGQPVDKDFVGGSQGGVYRDPKSGAVVEKKIGTNGLHPSAEAFMRLGVAQTRSRAASESSLAESDASEGLAAAAGFTAAIQGGAGSLPGPTLAQNATAPGAPTTALDASHAEHDPRTSSEMRGEFQGEREGRSSVPDSSAMLGWPSDMGAQITGFAVASSKRNSEFHALFPNVSEEDYLIEDYGCALVREVFIQGRLYVSENHICFNANIFGWVTNIVIPFSEIVSIEKRMTALIIPNAIQIATLHQKHTFSSFLGRDTTFDLVANIWKLSHPDVPSSAGAGVQEIEVVTDEDSDGEGGGTTATTPASSTMRAKLKKRLKTVKSGKDADSNTKEIKSNGSALADRTEPVKGNDADGAGKRKHPATSCSCDQDKKHLAVTALDTVYPTTPEKLYNLMFKNDDFMKNFWTVDEKLFELQVGDWKADPAHDGLPTRNFSYIKPLSGSIGPKQTKCNITDENLHIDFEEYITVLSTTRTPDVPSGNSFSVKTRTCITWNGGGNVAKLFVTCATEWTGRSMLKSVIDKASIDGQKQYYKSLDAAIKRHIKEHSTDFREEGDSPEDVEAAINEQAEEGAKKEADHASCTEATGEGLLAQIFEQVKEIGSTLSDVVGGALGEVSPSMLALGGVVLLLIVSNIWALSSSGAGRGQSRDPLDPHRLRSRSSDRATPVPEAVEIANAVRDVLRDHLEPLKKLGGASPQPVSVEECRGEAASILAELEAMEKRIDQLKKVWLEMVSQGNKTKALEGGA